MKISLATNFDNDLIELVKKQNIYEMYGKLKNDIIGGGRPNNTLNELDRKKFETHVKKVRNAGINFNYLLNAACLANIEQDNIWQEKLIEFLDYLKSVGVNAITVANYHLLQFIKANYDCFIVRVSTFNNIDSVFKAKYWEEAGADIICIDFRMNRNFKLLKEILESLEKTKVELLITNSCLKECPIMNTHTNSLSHASNVFDSTNQYEDWCLHLCQQYQLEHLEEYIKSPWIRPEDIKTYESLGIEHFKITERDFPTNELVKRVDAYTSGIYDGNLLDMVQGHGYSSDTEEKLVKSENLISRLDILNEIKRIRGLGCERKVARHINIDNRKLDGFLDFFIKDNCNNNCNKCTYCKSISDKVISKNDEISNYLVYLYDIYNSKKYKKRSR